MFPSGASNDMRNVSFGDAETARTFTLTHAAFREFPDGQHLTFCKFAESSISSITGTPRLNAVSNIVIVGTPRKVLGAVVGSNMVRMPHTAFSKGLRAMKSLTNKAMSLLRRLVSIFRDRILQVSVGAGKAPLHLSEISRSDSIVSPRSLTAWNALERRVNVPFRIGVVGREARYLPQVFRFFHRIALQNKRAQAGNPPLRSGRGRCRTPATCALSQTAGHNGPAVRAISRLSGLKVHYVGKYTTNSGGVKRDSSRR